MGENKTPRSDTGLFLSDYWESKQYLGGHERRVAPPADAGAAEGQLQAAVALGQAAAKVTDHQTRVASCREAQSEPPQSLAETQDLDTGRTRIRLQQHVVGFQIPVGDALSAQMVDALQELQHHQRLLPAARRGLCQEPLQRVGVTRTPEKTGQSDVFTFCCSFLIESQLHPKMLNKFSA